MAFKSILTFVGATSGDADLRAAGALCAAGGAHLSVLVLGLAAPPPMGEFAMMTPDLWLEERQAEIRALKERAAAVTAMLAKDGPSADVSCSLPDAGRADEIVGRRARYCDLAVIGPDMLADRSLRDKVVEGVLFSSGRPLLLLPRPLPDLRPRRVTIGWDAGVEAARAVREALPFLAGAEEVRVVLVDPVESDDAHGAEPGADLAAYLARHGARVVVDRLPSSGRPVEEVLARHASDTGSDLLAIGAYGHSRLRERIFGGVTRSMVENPPLPVLLAR